mmetsp:Transcript_53716/g.142842  ORF Transcript_53716/g.142842 Transcript_53716/m.142842 type:complete len:608 (+) Transcript_53716:140-1963(+)
MSGDGNHSTLAEAGYEELRMIGRGNYGSAHLVRRTSDKRHFVAKKVALACLSEKERVGAYQEVELLEKLQHPFIVEYQQTFMLRGDILVIIMQYCEGGDMASYIKQTAKDGRFFGEGTIMSWFVQTLRALDYIHSRKVLHRDLKTSNIFLTKKASIVKIGDFGISRVLEGTMEAITVVGTPYYMSPEVCENKPYTFKSDVWALGCVLYELCVLKHAFSASNLLGLVYKIVSDKYDPIPDRYSPELNDIIRKLLTKQAEQRPGIQAILSNPYVARESERYMKEFVATNGACGEAQYPPHSRFQRGKSQGDVARTTSASRIGAAAGVENPQEAMRRRKLEKADRQAEMMKQAVRASAPQRAIAKQLKEEQFHATARDHFRGNASSSPAGAPRTPFGAEASASVPEYDRFASACAHPERSTGSTTYHEPEPPYLDGEDEDSFRDYEYPEEYEDDFEEYSDLEDDDPEEIQEEIAAELQARDEMDLSRVVDDFQTELTLREQPRRPEPFTVMETQVESSPVPTPTGWNDRVVAAAPATAPVRANRLRDECIQALGLEAFNEAFQYLLRVRDSSSESEKEVKKHLNSLIGADRVKKYGLTMDQLVYEQLMSK